MQLPSEMDSPLDRRAQTIDILTAEIERKNRTIKAWRIKYDELEEKTELLQDEVKELKVDMKEINKQNSEILRLIGRIEGAMNK